MTRGDQQENDISQFLPTLFGTTRFPDKDNAHNIFDVRFYPFTRPGVEPIFAITVERKTAICRVSKTAGRAMEVMRLFEDEEAEAQLHDLTWAQDPATGDPLICVSGAKPPHIRIINVNTGKLLKTLVGHGERVNGLTTSPLSPTIIASGSEDNTIRVWDLMRRDDNNSCVALLAGGGHRLGLYSVAFHKNGRYMLSGGLDTAINLWVVPDLVTTRSDQDPVEDLVYDHGMPLIYYPHFSTTEVHGDHVDCVEFYNDLIFSKSAREPYILLWRIFGFSSGRDIPPRSAAPTEHPSNARTRSAFTQSSDNAFQVLFRFDMPNCAHTWAHFGLFHAPHAHPLLIMGSDNMWLSIWDLELIEMGYLGTVTLKHQTKDVVAPVTSDEKTGIIKKDTVGPFDTLKPHRAIRVPNVGFEFPCYTVRHFSFSPGGEWCVVVGDSGMVTVLEGRNQYK